MDELQSAVHAFQSWPVIWRTVLEFDPHPPLYYLQLNAWMAGGTSDAWLRMNTFLYSILAVISLYITARLIFNRRVAILAAFLLAISPFAIAFSIEVRMYTLFLLLAIWQWFLTHHFILTDRPLLAGVVLILVSLVAMCTYGAAFLLLLSSFVYGSLLLWTQPGRERRNQ